MKKLLFSAALFAGLIFAGNVKAQDGAVDPNAPVMKFQHDTIDYGTIAHNADGYRYFKFTNTGKEPLIIKDAHGSCGCTIPTWPKEPIQPGQENEIKVHYATDRVGRFQKTVTINSNANPSSIVIYIMGNVLPDDPNTTKTTPPTPTPVPVSGGGK
jgi:hypothetical protein